MEASDILNILKPILRKKKFEMESIHSLTTILQKPETLSTIDVKDAYLHILIL